MATLTPTQKIEKAHVSIMQSNLFRVFSGLTMIGKVIVDETIPTAGTDGRDVYYGTEFIGRLNNKQVLFIVLHELSHIAYRHLSTWKYLYDKDKILANMACDYVINLQLLDQDPNGAEIEFPTNENGERIGCVDEKYRGMDAHQVFNELVKEHGTGEKYVLVHGDGDQFDEHDFENAGEMTDQEKQDLATRVQQALHQGKQLAGKMGGELPRGIKELVEPQVSWQEMLRDLVKVVCKGSGDSSWKRFSKKYLGIDVYMPNNIDHKVGRILVADDTSGSIGDEMQSIFMSEIKSICEEVHPEGLDLLYWGTSVVSHEFYTESELEGLVSSTKPVGGGGTDPNCIPAYIKEHKLSPEIIIVLTDGEFYDGTRDFKELTVPVVWCVVNNKYFNSDVGKTIHIKM